MFIIKYKAIIYVFIAALFASVGQIFFKFAANNNLIDVMSFIFNPYVYIGVLFYGLGFIFMLKALLYGEVTLVYPMMATSFIWVCLMSPFFFPADSVSLHKWIGIGIILIGVYFVAKGGKK